MLTIVMITLYTRYSILHDPTNIISTYMKKFVCLLLLHVATVVFFIKVILWNNTYQHFYLKC